MSAIDVLKTASKIEIQKAEEATVGLFGKKLQTELLKLLNRVL